MNKLLEIYKKNKVLLNTIFVFAIVVFGYFGVNNVINNDGIADLIIDATSKSDHRLYISVGRWGWALIGLVFKYYPSPFLYLIINAVAFSLSTYFLTKIFHVKKVTNQILVGMVLTSFPINIVAYSYSPWQMSLGISILSSILSIYVLVNATKWYHYLLSAFLMAFVISTYQMFLPIILVLLVCLTISNVAKKKPKESLIELSKYALMFGLGCLIYIVMVKLTTMVFQIEMDTYQGANEMFNFNISVIFKNLVNSFLHCIYQHKIAFYPVICHIVLILTTILSYITCVKKNKNKFWIYSFLYLCLLIAPQFLRFFKPNQWYHNVTFLPYAMVYASSLAILFNNIDCIKKVEKYIVILLVITIGIFVIEDNRAGVMAQNTTNASYAYINRLQYRIESTEGYSSISGEKKYYFVGEASDFWAFPYSSHAYTHTIGITTNFVYHPYGIVDALNVLGIDGYYYNESIDDKIENEILEIAKTRSAYPALDSIFIYDDIIVIVQNKDSN